VRTCDVLKFIIDRGPGRTERQLAEAIFGVSGYQQRVNQDCQLLLSTGAVERRGGGKSSDPYTYYPAPH